MRSSTAIIFGGVPTTRICSLSASLLTHSEHCGWYGIATVTDTFMSTTIRGLQGWHPLSTVPRLISLSALCSQHQCLRTVSSTAPMHVNPLYARRLHEATTPSCPVGRLSSRTNTLDAGCRDGPWRSYIVEISSENVASSQHTRFSYGAIMTDNIKSIRLVDVFGW